MPHLPDLLLDLRSTSTSSEDPFTKALKPHSDETPTERAERVHAEREAKRISDEIDEEIRRETAALKKTKPVRVLLLGQSESGKSTTLKNFQIHYAPQAWQEERACWRAVIQLNLIRSVALIVDALAWSPSYTSTPAHPLELSPLSSRYAPLLARLSVAERILKRCFSPSEPDEPGDYRTFTACGSSSAALPERAGLPPSQHREEFFVCSTGVAGSWKSRFMRRISASPPCAPKAGMRGSVDSSRDDATEIIMECREEINRLWNDPDVKDVLVTSKMEDTPGFFLNDVNRIAARGYEPSDDDVLRARLRTMGVQEHRFTFELGLDAGREWRVYDVGGARSQPGQPEYDLLMVPIANIGSWLSFFDEVDAIIFLAPISCFDETLAEDQKTNRLDSLTLWQTLCRSPLLAHVQLVLFLNKVDILRRKIASGAVVAHHVTSFGDRTNDVETVSRYFKQKFGEILKQHSLKPRPYYVYFTTVTDSIATGITLDIVREAILRSNLHKAHMIL